MKRNISLIIAGIVVGIIALRNGIPSYAAVGIYLFGAVMAFIYIYTNPNRKKTGTEILLEIKYEIETAREQQPLSSNEILEYLDKCLDHCVKNRL